MKKVFWSLMLVLAAVAASVVMVQAQDEDMDPDALTVYGVIVSVTAQKIVISEYDIETDDMVNAPYAVDAKVKLGNVAKVTDLKAGQAVDIEYEEKGGQKVAVKITLDTENSDELEEGDDASGDEN